MKQSVLAPFLVLAITIPVGLAQDTPVASAAASGRVMASPFADSVARFERAERTGFRWTSANAFPGAYVGKFGATDDGPYGLPLLGGIGTGAFGRDLHGHFNR